MLGKLLKYDMKRQIKLLAAAYLVVGLTAGAAAIFRLVYMNFEDTSGVLSLVSALTSGLAILAVVVMVAGTLIYAVLYFRKNLFKDEGYLMHTLPVKPWQLYVGKLISGTLLSYLSILVAVAALCLAYLHIPNVFDFMSGLTDAGMPGWFIGVTAIVLVLAIPANLIQFYASLAFGYTIRTNTATPVNKDLLSVISYIVIYMGQQIVSIGILVVWAILNVGKIGNFASASMMPGAEIELSAGETFGMMGGIYGISLAFLLVLSVALSVLSVWRMNRHLNLN